MASLRTDAGDFRPIPGAAGRAEAFRRPCSPQAEPDGEFERRGRTAPRRQRRRRRYGT